MIPAPRLRSLTLLGLCTMLSGCAQSPYPAFGPYSGSENTIEDTSNTLRIDPVWQYEVNLQGIAGFKPVEPYGLTTTQSGIVAVATFSGKIHAFDAGSGAHLWMVDLKESPGSSPTAYYDFLYIGVSDGRLIALHAKDGSEAWSTQLDHIIHGQPTVHDGVLYVMTSEEALIALDAHTGDKLWTHRHPRLAELEIQGGGQPAVLERNIYVGFSDGTLHKISRQGDRIWSADLSRSKRRMIDVDSPAIEYKHVVIAVSHSGGVYAVDKETGSIEWSLDQQGVQTPLLVDDTLILTTTSGKIFWVDADSGQIYKELKLERPGLTAPMRFTADTFAVADADRGVFLIGIDDNRLEALFETTVGISGQMALWEDMLFVLTNRGMVYGLKARYQ